PARRVAGADRRRARRDRGPDAGRLPRRRDEARAGRPAQVHVREDGGRPAAEGGRPRPHWPGAPVRHRGLGAAPRGRTLRREPGGSGLVRDPQEVWRVLVTDAAAFEPGKWKRRARRFLGDTLNTLDGEEHRRRRLALQPALDRRRIARFEPAIAARVERLQAGWQDGVRLRLRDELDRLSLAIAG